MIKLNLIVILLTVLLSALAQICLKIGSRVVDHQKITGANLETLVYSVKLLFDPVLLLGLAMYAISAVAWIWVLSKEDISFAYPFVSLSFLITLVFGIWLFGESLTVMKVAGTLLIISGCALITQA